MRSQGRRARLDALAAGILLPPWWVLRLAVINAPPAWRVAHGFPSELPEL